MVYEMAKKIQKRCDSILGFKPEITVNSNFVEKINPKKFEFKLKNLHKLNINCEENYNEEIDDLLHYCQ